MNAFSQLKSWIQSVVFITHIMRMLIYDLSESYAIWRVFIRSSLPKRVSSRTVRTRQHKNCNLYPSPSEIFTLEVIISKPSFPFSDILDIILKATYKINSTYFDQCCCVYPSLSISKWQTKKFFLIEYKTRIIFSKYRIPVKDLLKGWQSRWK